MKSLVAILILATVSNVQAATMLNQDCSLEAKKYVEKNLGNNPAIQIAADGIDEYDEISLFKVFFLQNDGTKKTYELRLNDDGSCSTIDMISR